MAKAEKEFGTFYENPNFPGKRNPNFKAVMIDHEWMTPPRAFDEYKERYKNTFLLDRTEDGIVTAKWHTNGSDLQYSLAMHRACGQLFEDLGQDSDTEVLILGGAGDTFLSRSFSLIDEDNNLDWYAYEHMFFDGPRMVSALVNNLRIPTIGVINGSGSHTELALLCDITLMAEDAVIGDPHFVMGGIPGDGIQTALRGAMGLKRANYAMMMYEQIDAKTALEYGMVNEILPKEKIYDRAMEIAKFFMTKPRTTRRLTAELMKQPWQKAFAEELRPNFGMEMWSFFQNPGLNHESGARAIEEWKKLNAKKD